MADEPKILVVEMETPWANKDAYAHLNAVPIRLPKRSIEGAMNMNLDKDARDYFRRQVADAVHKALLDDPDLIENVVKA